MSFLAPRLIQRNICELNVTNKTKTDVPVSNFWLKSQQLVPGYEHVLTSGVPTSTGFCSTLAVAYDTYADKAKLAKRVAHVTR
jgi:hypothetical protein